MRQGAGAWGALREDDNLDDVPIMRTDDDHFVVVDEVLAAPPGWMNVDQCRRHRRETNGRRHARGNTVLDHLRLDLCLLLRREARDVGREHFQFCVLARHNLRFARKAGKRAGFTPAKQCRAL